MCAQGSKSQLSLLNIITELKKCCNHPFLFNTAEVGTARCIFSMYAAWGSQRTTPANEWRKAVACHPANVGCCASGPVATRSARNGINTSEQLGNQTQGPEETAAWRFPNPATLAVAGAGGGSGRRWRKRAPVAAAGALLSLQPKFCCLPFTFPSPPRHKPTRRRSTGSRRARGTRMWRPAWW